jgi:hypothetical protein
MTVKARHLAISAVLAAGALPLGAQAEFRCAQPESRIDRNACVAASQGPTELRHYVWRMRPVRSLNFADYVDDATARAWDDARARTAAGADAKIPTVAAAEKPERR